MFYFFFKVPPPTETYTLSLTTLFRSSPPGARWGWSPARPPPARRAGAGTRDRKSTRLNSSHGYISYAVFCLKKKTVHCLINTMLRPNILKLFGSLLFLLGLAAYVLAP